MSRYKINPEISVAFIPGVGKVKEGKEIVGDYSKYVPSLLVEVPEVPMAAKPTLTASPPPSPLPVITEPAPLPVMIPPPPSPPPKLEEILPNPGGDLLQEEEKKAVTSVSTSQPMVPRGRPKKGT